MLCYIVPRRLLKTSLPDKWSQWDQVELVPVLSDECSGCAVGPGTPGGFSAFPDGWAVILCDAVNVYSKVQVPGSSNAWTWSLVWGKSNILD